MDRDEAIRRAEMFLSWLRGENQYQWARRDDPNLWCTLSAPEDGGIWYENFFGNKYLIRLKPKPLDLWIARYPNGSFQAADTRPPTDTERVMVSEQGGQWIKFREVTDE